MRAGGASHEGVRLRRIIVVLWRAGLRISDALALTETDLDPQTGVGAGPRWEGRREAQDLGMDDWAWEHYSEVLVMPT